MVAYHMHPPSPTPFPDSRGPNLRQQITEAHCLLSIEKGRKEGKESGKEERNGVVRAFRAFLSDARAREQPIA